MGWFRSRVEIGIRLYLVTPENRSNKAARDLNGQPCFLSYCPKLPTVTVDPVIAVGKGIGCEFATVLLDIHGRENSS